MQFERGEALEKITQDVKRVLEEECDEESLKVLPKAVDTVRKMVSIARMIFSAKSHMTISFTKLMLLFFNFLFFF